MTKSLKEIESANLDNNNLTFTLMMYKFKETLDEVLPEHSPSLKVKYELLGKNMYQNEFLAELLYDVPTLINEFETSKKL